MAGNNDLFENPEPVTTDNPSSADDKKWLDEMVGEGKRYSDPEALAKAKMHADHHISQLEKDNEELRQEVLKRQSVEDFYERLQRDGRQQPAPSNQGDYETPDEQKPGQPEISLNEVKSLVNEAVGEYVSSEKQKKNKAFVMKELERRIGPGFQVEMKRRAESLGETTEDLTKIALSKPLVFLELMAPEKKGPPPSNPGAPRTEQNSVLKPGTAGVRDHSYYEELKRSDPKTYFSKATRVQMMNDAIALGESFYN